MDRSSVCCIMRIPLIQSPSRNGIASPSIHSLPTVFPFFCLKPLQVILTCATGLDLPCQEDTQSSLYMYFVPQAFPGQHCGSSLSPLRGSAVFSSDCTGVEQTRPSHQRLSGSAWRADTGLRGIDFCHDSTGP